LASQTVPAKQSTNFRFGRLDPIAKPSPNDGYLRTADGWSRHAFRLCGTLLLLGGAPIGTWAAETDERSVDLGAPLPCFRSWTTRSF
jgi:hypothetical protein